MKNISLPALLYGFGAISVISCAPPLGKGGDDSSENNGKNATTLPDGSSADAALPARIRRLSNAEYNASVQALLGTALTPADTFPPDTRQQGYTLNEAQRVDPVLARQLDAAALALASEARAQLDSIAPCPDSKESACAASFIKEFGARAYRRALTPEDEASLTLLYEQGSRDASYADGIALVIRGILQSPGFLYLTEIGDGTNNGVIALTDHELAASLSYLLTGGPPDEELRAAASSGSFNTPEQRRAQAERLVRTPAGQERAIRFVKEWLGVDRISSTAKDANVYPAYEALRPDMAAETQDFIAASLESSDGSLDELLGATWTIASAELAAMYGSTGEGRIEVPERPGLLNRAAFLSVYSHAHESAPVLRGTALLRRITCEDIELPTNLQVEIVPPVPDPTLTTRERFAIHSADAGCAGCHRKIDPLGFSFEQFDAMGAYRSEENSRPIDSSGDIDLGLDFDGPVANSGELASAIAQSAAVAECFAQQIFRAGSGEGVGAEESEHAFIESWNKLPATEQRNLIELLTTFASSDLMAYRSEQ